MENNFESIYQKINIKGVEGLMEKTFPYQLPLRNGEKIRDLTGDADCLLDPKQRD